MDYPFKPPEKVSLENFKFFDLSKQKEKMGYI